MSVTLPVRKGLPLEPKKKENGGGKGFVHPYPTGNEGTPHEPHEPKKRHGRISQKGKSKSRGGKKREGELL